MPNHVTTKLTIEGPPEAVQKFASLHLIAIPAKQATSWTGEPLFLPDGSPRMNDAYMQFDFNTIIPRPSILDGIVSGSETYLAVEAITGKTPFELTGKGLDFAMFNTPEHKARRQEQMDKLTVEQLEKGMQALKAIEECGHTDWYGWSVENWGTKWNAYEFELVDQEPDKLVIRFQTAWSVPVPVLQRLVELHPRLNFVAVSFDECWNFAACTTVEQGKVKYLELEPDKALYKEVYGEEPVGEEEEETIE